MRFPWTKREEELELEVRHHIEMLADEYERGGMERGEALRAAGLEFGHVEGVKERCRDERRWRWLADFGRDVRYGWRTMRRAPAVTLAVVLSLGLGIGATAAMVRLADVLMWRKLPVEAPEMLSEVLWESRGAVRLYRSAVGGMYDDGAVKVADFFSLAAFEGMREAVRGRAELAGFAGGGKVSASVEGGAVTMVELMAVDGEFLRVLGVAAERGRLLRGGDDDAAAPLVVVLSERYWRRQLGGVEVVGRRMRLKNRSYEIVGVAGAGFQGIAAGEDVDVIVAMKQAPRYLEDGAGWDESRWWVHAMMRRGRGESEEGLRAAMDGAFRASWGRALKAGEAAPRVRVEEASRGLGEVRREFGRPVRVLLVLVGLVLAAACANIANLLLARGVGRAREVALRVALGGGRARLARQFLAESLLLAAMGGAASVPVMVGILAGLGGMMGGAVRPMLIEARPDGRALAGAAALTVMTALVFGLYPAWRNAGLEVGPGLRRFAWRPARLMVLGQVALGVVLMAAAVLFTVNLWELAHRETGMERAQVVMFGVRPGEFGYEEGRLGAYWERLERELGETAGVRAVGFSTTRPMGRSGWYDMARLEDGSRFPVAVHHVTPGFFEALRIPMVAGRALGRGDGRVAVVSEEFAARMGGRAVGRWFVNGARGEDRYEIVGVARRARYADMRRDVVLVYLPMEGEAAAATVVLGTRGAPEAVMGGVRAAARGLDARVPLVDVFTMEEQIARTLERERLFAWLCGGFGVLALVLCVVGQVGLLSHEAARRRHEIGVRMALGATRGGIVRGVLRGGVVWAFGGMVLGMGPAVMGMQFAAKSGVLVYETVQMGALVVALGLVGASLVVASVGPAWRAASVDAWAELRRE